VPGFYGPILFPARPRPLKKIAFFFIFYQRTPPGTLPETLNGRRGSIVESNGRVDPFQPPQETKIMKSFKTYIRRLKKQISTGAKSGQAEIYWAPGLQATGRIKVILRPASAADTGGAVRLHARLSLDSLYMRYLRPYKPTAAEIEQVCRMAAPEGAAYVAQMAQAPHAIVGLAYYRRNPNQAGAVAEPAIVIDDSFQGLGIGTALFDFMRHAARTAGIEWFHAHTHPRNTTMRHLMHKTSRGPVREIHHGGSVESRLDLSLPDNGGRLGFLKRYMPEGLFAGCDLGLDQGL
jgi:RimJ/RimL family protein N-acetyltransferase